MSEKKKKFVCPKCGGDGGEPGRNFGDTGWMSCYHCYATGYVDYDPDKCYKCGSSDKKICCSSGQVQYCVDCCSEHKPPWWADEPAGPMPAEGYKLKYKAIDGAAKYGTFKTKKGALAFVERWVGTSREYSGTFNYIVSWDGVGKVTGVNFKLSDLWKPDYIETPGCCDGCEHPYHDEYNGPCKNSCEYYRKWKISNAAQGGGKKADKPKEKEDENLPF